MTKRDELLALASATFGGFLLATALCSATLKPDDRFWLFLLEGVIFVAWPVYRAIAAQGAE